MTRGMLTLTVVCLSLMFGIGAMSYADSETDAVLMQEHLNKVKRTKPEKYQAMVQRAGGKGQVKNCGSCHVEVVTQTRRK